MRASRHIEGDRPPKKHLEADVLLISSKSFGMTIEEVYEANLVNLVSEEGDGKVEEFECWCSGFISQYDIVFPDFRKHFLRIDVELPSSTVISLSSHSSLGSSDLCIGSWLSNGRPYFRYPRRTSELS